MKKIRVLKKFYDKRAEKERNVGDVFEATNERFYEIVGGLYSYDPNQKWIEEIEDEDKRKGESKNVDRDGENEKHETQIDENEESENAENDDSLKNKKKSTKKGK